jgi:mannose-6-phosphate isomerase-like protein (cupin superfamily)
VKVGGQEEETQGGDAIYIPNGVAHGCRSTLKDQTLNVFCLGVAIPHDAQVWTEEDLPDAPI